MGVRPDFIIYAYRGYEPVYGYSKKDKIYRGKISNTDDLIIFEGRDFYELCESFYEAVDNYIEFKKEIGKK